MNQKTRWYAAIGKGCMEDLVWGYGNSPDEATNKALGWGYTGNILVIAVNDSQIRRIKSGEIQAIKYMD
jgi:hypothetical protein